MTVQKYFLLITMTATALLSTGRADGAILDPGSAFGLDMSSGNPVIHRFNRSGTVVNGAAIIESIGLQPTGTIGMRGVASVDGRLFVTADFGGTGDRVYEYNPTTGAIITSFSTGALATEGLGEDGTFLYVGEYSNNQVRKFSTSGALVQVIGLSGGFAGLTGIDVFANVMYVGDYNNGIIRTFNATTGAYTGAINLAIDENNAISGLAFDESSNSLLVSYGFGSRFIRQFDLNGNLINQSSTGRFYQGLEIIRQVQSQVPEPSSYITFAGLALCFGLTGWWRKRKMAV